MRSGGNKYYFRQINWPNWQILCSLCVC